MKKSIFLFFAAILCASSVWAADVAKNTVIYFDNSVSQWNYQFHYFTINDNYGWKMTKVDNTLLYVHKRTANTWGGYSKVRLFATDGDWGNDKSLCGGENNMKQYGANLTKTVTNYGFNADNYYTLKPDKKGSSSSQASLTASWIGNSYTALNKTITAKAKVSTDKGASYAEKTSPGTLTASSFIFTAYNSCKSATSLSSGKISCGYTANTTLTAQTDVEGYVFAGWYNESGTKQTENATLTINPTADATYYAYYVAEAKHTVTISYKYGSTDVTASNSKEVGESTPSSIIAPKVIGYKFVDWTLGDGVQTTDALTSETINITTKSSGSYTLTANYEKLEVVYFVNNSKWSNVKIYGWGGNAPAEEGINKWAGVGLTKTSEKIGNYDIYVFDATTDFVKQIIFNNGNNGDDNQTKNYVWADGNYYWHGNANDFADKIEYISDAISSIKFHKLKTDNMTDKINTLKDSLNTILKIINTYNNVDVKHTRQFANKLSHVSDAINGIELIPGKIDIASLVNNRDNLIVLYDVIKDSN